MNPHLTLTLSPPIRLRQAYGGTGRMGAERGQPAELEACEATRPYGCEGFKGTMGEVAFAEFFARRRNVAAVYDRRISKVCAASSA